MMHRKEQRERRERLRQTVEANMEQYWDTSHFMRYCSVVV